MKCTIIGDRPPWFSGHMIEQQRVPEQPYRGFRDMLAKVHTMANHPEIDDEFVWMMDDIYLIRNLCWDDLDIPRAYQWREDRHTTWQKLKSDSMRELRGRGRTTHDYATHLPHTVNKSQLKQVFAEFDLVGKTMLWEVLYGNTFKSHPQQPEAFFARTSKVDNQKSLKAKTEKAFILNHTADGWTPVMKAFLKRILPDPGENELTEFCDAPKIKEPERREPTVQSRNSTQKKRTKESKKMQPHYILIQSAYTDAELSRRRLQISRSTCIPSLKYQTHQPIVHVVVNPADPLLNERKAAFQETGCETRFIERDSWKLYGEDWELPSFRKVVSRVDDDDCLAKKFIEMVNLTAPFSGDFAIIWPTGYVYWRNSFYVLTHPGNQFVSLVSSTSDPHQTGHWKYHKEWKTKVVSDKPGWIWIRHGDAATSTLQKYRPRLVRKIDLSDIPIDVGAMAYSIAESGEPSADYREHAKPKEPVLSPAHCLGVCGSDKVTIHNYGAFYDSLFAKVNPQRLLEIGGFKGASMRAWKMAKPSLKALVLDRSPIPGQDTILCVTPDFWPAIQRLSNLEPMDIIIDDGSHKIGCQVSGANNLWQFLRPGGIYVIEDLQDQQAVDYFRSQGWQIEDFRMKTGRYDDVIAWKEKPANA